MDEVIAWGHIKTHVDDIPNHVSLPVKQIQEVAPYKLPYQDHHVEMHSWCQIETESNDE